MTGPRVAVHAAWTGAAAPHVQERREWLGQFGVERVADNSDNDRLLECFRLDGFVVARRLVAAVSLHDRQWAEIVLIDLTFGQREAQPIQFATDQPFKNAPRVGLDLTALPIEISAVKNAVAGA